MSIEHSSLGRFIARTRNLGLAQTNDRVKNLRPVNGGRAEDLESGLQDFSRDVLCGQRVFYDVVKATVQRWVEEFGMIGSSYDKAMRLIALQKLQERV